MDVSIKPALADAIREIETNLGFARSAEESHAYARGLLSANKLHPLAAYLTGAESYLLQEPGVARHFYYDIFETARTVLIVRILAKALGTLGDALPALNLPPFSGHPKKRNNARGVIHVREQKRAPTAAQVYA